MTALGVIVTAVLGVAKLFSKRIRFSRFDWVYSISAGPDY